MVISIYFKGVIWATELQVHLKEKSEMWKILGTQLLKTLVDHAPFNFEPAAKVEFAVKKHWPIYVNHLCEFHMCIESNKIVVPPISQELLIVVGTKNYKSTLKVRSFLCQL